MQRRTGKMILIVLTWLAAIAVATQLDASIAEWVKKTGCDTFLLTHPVLRQALRVPGVFWFTLLVAVPLLFLHPMRWRAAAFLLLANGVIAFNDVIKWAVGRTRPYKLGDDGALHPFLLQPFRGGLHGLFETKNLSFPSGDVAVAFASAAALSILLPKWRWAFFAVAAVVAAERILEDAHWLSDTLAAATYAVGGVWLLGRYVCKWLQSKQLSKLRGFDVVHG